MRILIAGGGSVGTQVVHDMSEAGGHEIVVIDIDADRAEALADEFDALVLQGDASDPDILSNAQISDADAVVVVTGSDATNTVIAMLAHRFEVERIIVRLDANALRGALDEIGVSDIVAPTMAAAARIESALRGHSRLEVTEVVQGRLQLAELTVGPSFDGRRLADAEIPEEAMFMAVVRGDEASLARGDDELAEGDAVVVVAETEDAIETCRKAIEG